MLARHVPSQMFGDVWEWTASAYLPYPRFRLFPPGARWQMSGIRLARWE